MNSKKTYITILIILMTSTIFAQGYNANYWHKKNAFVIDMGMVIPETEFASIGENGLYGMNGFTFLFDYSHGLKYGFRMGAFYDYNGFTFDGDEFAAFQEIPELDVLGRWNISRLGASLSYNLPIMFNEEVCMNIYGSANGGVRFVNIPKMTAFYSVTENRYTEVEYSSSGSPFGFYGYTGGVQFIFNKFGLDFSYKSSMGMSQNVTYTAKGTSPQGDEYEQDYELTGKFDFTGFQGGIIFWF